MRDFINTGYMEDCIIGNENIILNIFMDNIIFTKLDEVVDAINNLSKNQVILSEAILKQRENDSNQSEVLVKLARAAENNSVANLRMSETLIKDKELMERLIAVLEKHTSK